MAGEYWNIRLAIILGAVIALVALDIYAASLHITTLPIALNSILSVVSAVLAASALTRVNPPEPPKPT